jgi:hypothetical protein
METKELVQLLRDDKCYNCPLEKTCNVQYDAVCMLIPMAADRIEELERQLDAERAEKQAVFRLGQLDMQAAAVDALRDAADGTYGLVTSSLIEAGEIVRKIRVMDEAKCGDNIETGVKLADVPVGETFEIGDHEFIVLEHSGDTTAVILKNLLPDQAFGESNNYNGSDVDATCNKFADELERAIGKDNLCLHTVDLTSDDGLKDYGSVERKASLLTCETYRRFVSILDKHKVDAWWWLATAYSTPAHGFARAVKSVAPSGYIYYDYFNFGIVGVRPFCILKSHIFVSK